MSEAEIIPDDIFIKLKEEDPATWEYLRTFAEPTWSDFERARRLRLKEKAENLEDYQGGTSDEA